MDAMRWLLASALVYASCRGSVDKATAGVHALLLSEIDDFVRAARDLERAAPGATWDAQAISRMRFAWHRASYAYEKIEGPLAPIFPDLSLSIDDRYEAQLGGRPDPDPFDDSPVRGLRAIERILWADSIPTSVVDLEKSLPGYTQARFPETAEEAIEFKTKLCHRLIEDGEKLREQWSSQRPDLAFALDAIYWSIKEQRMEITRAATHEQESAYAGASMAALRANLEGARQVYERIRPLVLERGGAEADHDLLAVFDELGKGLCCGDALPPPPATWSSEHPSAADEQTPFGKLYTTMASAFDSTSERSAVSALRKIGQVLGIAYIPPT